MSEVSKPHSREELLEDAQALIAFIDHGTAGHAPTVDTHEIVRDYIGLIEQLEAARREIEVLRQTCAISFSDKDAGIATLIRRAESAEEQLESADAVLREIAALSAFNTPGQAGSLITGPAIARRYLGLTVTYPAKRPES